MRRFKLASNLKHTDVVDRVLWSEEVYAVPVDSENISRSFKKLWQSNTKKVQVDYKLYSNFKICSSNKNQYYEERGDYFQHLAVTVYRYIRHHNN